MAEPFKNANPNLAADYFSRFNLPQNELAERKSTVGGSDINIIAGGDLEAINRLWQQKVSGENDDLSKVWPVIMGVLTEELNLEFIQLKHGYSIVQRGRVIRGLNPIMRCTLDGAIADYKGGLAVIDAKFTLGYPMKGESYADVVPRLVRKYTPQLHWNARLLEEAEGVKVKHGLLSILRAGNEPVLHEVAIDPEYTEALIGKATYFMGCIDFKTPPNDIAVEAPVPVEERVEVDMTTTDQAEAWRRLSQGMVQTRGAFESYRLAETQIKKLVPGHASEAHGDGVRIKVAKNGAKKVEVTNE